MSHIHARAMAADEYDAIRALEIAAFADPGIGDLLDALRSTPSYLDELSFVAEHESEVVGHIQYSIAWLDAPDALIEVLVLSPLGVRPDHRGLGVGSLLVTESLEAVRSRPEPLVFVEGDPGYYGRFGFQAAGDLGFRKPSLRIPDPAFQVVALPSYDAATMTGTLVYPDAFWRTDSVGLR